MSSRSLQAARSRRAGENVPPVSGNRPVTSIGSQAAFAQQMPRGMGYNMPPPPNNVRTARAVQPQPPSYQQPQYHEEPQPSNNLPFNKLSISDAIGLITLRLGRVEQWVMDTEHENETSSKHGSESSAIPDGHKIIDNATLTTIINRLDSLEKNGQSSGNSLEEVKSLAEQFKRMSEEVSRHNIDLAKNTEQVFRFNRELTETKDMLKSFMIKYDMFTQETTQNFVDYEVALGDLEKRLPAEFVLEDSTIVPSESEPIGTSLHDIDGENNIIMTMDLKNEINQELAKS